MVIVHSLWYCPQMTGPFKGYFIDTAYIAGNVYHFKPILMGLN